MERTASKTTHDVTTLLGRMQQGDAAARDLLIERVYGELHQIARGLMAGERAGHTLQVTALLNEALVRLLDTDGPLDLKNRSYFFGAAVRAMRRVLVDHARQRATLSRGGDRQRVPLDETLEDFESSNPPLLLLDGLLDELAVHRPRAYEVVMRRAFGKRSMQEIADQLNISLSTVESDFAFARAWLRSRIAAST